MVNEGVTNERIQIVVDTIIKNRERMDQLKRDLKEIEAVSRAGRKAYNQQMKEQGLPGLSRAKFTPGEIGKGLDQVALDMKNSKINDFFTSLSQQYNKPVYDVVKAYRVMGNSFTKQGEPIDILGNKLTNVNDIMTVGFKKMQRFDANMLGVMFAGMALQRTMNGLIQTSFEWMGIQEVVNDTLGVVFLPIAEEVLNVLLPISEWFMNLTEEEQKIIGTIALIGAAIGTMLFTIGTISLGAQAIGKELGINILGGLKEKLKGVDVSKFLRNAGAVLAITMAVKDLKEGEVVAAMGDAMMAAGLYFKNGWVLGIGVALKLIGDTEFQRKIWEIGIKTVDFFINIGEMIGRAITGSLTIDDVQKITNPLDNFGATLEGMFLEGQLQSDLFKSIAESSLNGVSYTAQELERDMESLNDEIAAGKIPIDEQAAAWERVKAKYKDYHDYLIGNNEKVNTSKKVSEKSNVQLNQPAVGTLFNLALGSIKKVSDAVISPSGEIISTSPDDYIMATKKPQELGTSRNQSITVSPIYNISGVSSPDDVRKMIEENNRNLTAEIRRIVKI